MNLRLCLHVEISSLRLFSVAMWGLVNRKNFSVVQRLQRFVRFVYGFALAMMSIYLHIYNLLQTVYMYVLYIYNLYIYTKQINYKFIPTSLFRGRPLIRGFNENKLYHRLYTM